MPFTLRWIASGSASCFHAVGRLAAGRPGVQPEADAPLVEPTAELRRFCEARGLALDPFFAQLVPAAVSVESNRELAAAVLAKTLGRDGAKQHADALAGLLTACEQAYFRTFPKLVDELDLRSRPLRELWEAHGPGLLALAVRLSERRLIVDEATAAVVLPHAGGGGCSYAAYNSVVIEAVLANPVARLPETVRLAWLLALLNTDLPDVAESFGPGRAATVLSLALLPVVLAAAAELELVRFDDGLLAAAFAAWAPPQPAGAATLDVVRTWWTMRQERGTPWPVAAAALEQMLVEAAS